MRVVEASELEARWDDVLCEIEQGEAFTITRRGRVVARLVQEETPRGDEIFRALANIHASRTSESASPTRYP